MRKYISFVIFMALTFGFASCTGGAKEKMKEAKENVSAAKSVVKGLSKMEKKAEEYQKDMEKLQDVDPFTSESFRKWMPDELAGMKRTSFEFASAMGNQGTISFKNEEGDKTFTVTIIDGAGEMGSLVFASQGFITGFMDDYYSESEDKLERVVERKGNKAMETYHKERNSSEINVVVDKRFIVMAETKNIDVDDTWKLIDKLKVGKLK